MTVQRTTITLPSDLLEAARITAFHRRMSVSELIRAGLQKTIHTHFKPPKKTKKKQMKTPLEQFVGGRSLGFAGIEREKLYEDYLRKKVSA